jgi:hypothetical protein
VSARCTGCNRPIEWLQTAEGKKIPVDVSAPIYRWDGGAGAAVLVPADTRRAAGPAVSHFATCTKAGDFANTGRGVVDAVNYCNRNELDVHFRIGRVIVTGKLVDVEGQGESLELAVADYIPKATRAQ